MSFKGFAKKYDEWIPVGSGRLRPLTEGPAPTEGFEDEFYVVEEVMDVRTKAGRKEYHVKWEGYEVTTWEPKGAFVGGEAKERLAIFLRRLRRETEEAAAAAAAAQAAEVAGSMQPPQGAEMTLMLT